MTREQFLFHEMRITAKLLNDGLTDEDVINKVIAENLFQYPTERQIKNIAHACIKRLNSLDDRILISAVATQSSDVAKQICLYRRPSDRTILLMFSHQYKVYLQIRVGQYY